GQARVIELPFAPTLAEPRWGADDRSLFMLGRVSDDTTGQKLFVIPLSGEQPRAIANVGTGANGLSLSVAPGGESVAYSVWSNRTTSLLLVDIRPATRRPASGRTRP